ncbi:hypothetical protein H2248_008977 [Termitomyces sp. 'cryptogamus']|nr:hypothetical protein H2248_008977 [Termitomyces sp. 'cryptogamus']
MSVKSRHAAWINSVFSSLSLLIPSPARTAKDSMVERDEYFLHSLWRYIGAYGPCCLYVVRLVISPHDQSQRSQPVYLELLGLLQTSSLCDKMAEYTYKGQGRCVLPILARNRVSLSLVTVFR